MTKTDSELEREVLQELHCDPRVASADIGVAARDGVISLSGGVESFATEYAAVRVAERIPGVRAIADELVVSLPISFERADTDIARAVASTLEWDVQVPDETIEARVENGWVWLEGEVEWPYQMAAAERAVSSLVGVRGLTSSIRVKARAPSDSNSVAAEATEGHVMPPGKPRSWGERLETEPVGWYELFVQA